MQIDRDFKFLRQRLPILYPMTRATPQHELCSTYIDTTCGARFPGPRAALGMTWESVPSIRLLLAKASREVEDTSAASQGGRRGCTNPSAFESRVATLLKHPAQVRFAWTITGKTFGFDHWFAAHEWGSNQTKDLCARSMLIGGPSPVQLRDRRRKACAKNSL